MLLTTCLTPLTFLASLVALSFCRCVSTVPASVTTPCLTSTFERAAFDLGVAGQLDANLIEKIVVADGFVGGETDAGEQATAPAGRQTV